MGVTWRQQDGLLGRGDSRKQQVCMRHDQLLHGRDWVQLWQQGQRLVWGQRSADGQVHASRVANQAQRPGWLSRRRLPHAGETQVLRTVSPRGTDAHALLTSALTAGPGIDISLLHRHEQHTALHAGAVNFYNSPGRIKNQQIPIVRSSVLQQWEAIPRLSSHTVQHMTPPPPPQ